MANPYPDPIYSHNAGATTGAGAVIDIATADQTGYPPVMIVSLTGTPTISYRIEGSHDGVNFVDFSNGGFTDPVAKDLIPGVRFWRTNIVTIAGGGSLTSTVGAMPTQEGTRAVNNVIRASTIGPSV